MEYYSTVKKKKKERERARRRRRRKSYLATAWMNLDSMMLSEISQSEKDKNHIISLMCEV